MAVDKVGYESVPQKEKYAELPEIPNYKPPQGWGARHTQVLLLFVCLSCGYSMRAQLSVSLVAMTSNSTLRMWYPNISSSCFYPGTNNNFTSGFYRSNMSAGNDTFDNNDGKFTKTLHHSNASEGNYTHSDEKIRNDYADEACHQMEESLSSWNVYRVYNWDKPTQEMILFSFFVGYTSMMIPMGMIAQKYGGKVTIMTALVSNGMLSFLTPWMPVFGGWIGVCACRLLQGMTQAAFFPSIHTMLGKWAPISERGRFSAYIYTGSQFGTVVAFQLAGLFAGSPVLGWPSTFWFCGILGLLFFALMAFLGAATPYEHPNISSEEFEYIVGGTGSDGKPKERRTPWKRILTSPAIWGIVAAHAGSNIGYLFILTQIPLYMSKILGVDIKRNGLLSSLPYISMYLTSICFGNLADWCVNKKILSVVNIRRVSNSIGLVVASVFLIAFCYVDNTIGAVILLILCFSSHSGIHTGFCVNSIDLAPNFAGPIMALSNMLANLSGLGIPVIVSNVIGNDVTNHYKWQILFLIVAAIQTLTNVIFVAFARGEVQEWNFCDGENDQGTDSINKLKKESKN